MSNRDFAGRGFLARFLYSLPVSTVGTRRYETAPIPPLVEEAYTALLDKLLLVPDLGETRIIKLTPEAYQESKRFADVLEPRLRDDLEEVEGWAGKYHGQVMRTAALIHCCIHGDRAAVEPISLETMENAETIGDYFLAHAKAAFQIMGLTDGEVVQDAKYIIKRLNGQEEISKRDLFRLCDGKFRRVEDMESGLATLADRGYIAVETAKTGGRPTVSIFVNPESTANDKRDIRDKRSIST